MHRIRLGLI